MKKTYNIYYNDGAYYGTITFTNKTSEEIENCISEEIKENKKNINSLYHINRNNFKLI